MSLESYKKGMPLKSYKKGDEELILNPTLADIECPSLKTFFRFWIELVKKHGKPSRKNFSPHDLKAFMSWLTIIDYERDSARFRHRLLGTQVVEAIGADYTGKYFDEIDNTGYPIERMQWLVDNEQPYYVSSNSMQWVTNNFYGYEGLGCPLFDDDGNVSMIMFAFAFRRKYDKHFTL